MSKIIEKYEGLSNVVKATLWFLVCNILQKGISLITIPIFTRLLTTEDYGLFSLYNSWLMIFSIFTTFKLNYGVFNKGMLEYSDDKDVYVSTMQTITTVFTFVFFGIYILFHKVFLNATELPNYFVVLMIVQMIFEPAISFWSLRERYDFKYRAVIAITLILSILNPLIGVVAVLAAHDRGAARILSFAAVDIAFCVVIYFWNYKKSHFKIKMEHAKFALSFNLPLIPHYMSEYVLDQSDRIMIQKMCSLDSLGLYSVAYNGGMVMKIIVTSLNSAFIPWLYRAMSDKKFPEIKKIVNYLIVVLIVPLFIFVLLAPEILKILAPPQYYGAVNVIPPVTASVFFIFLFGIYGNIEFFYDKNKFTMYLSIISAVLNIVLNYLFIPVLGYIVAAYNTLLCYIVLGICHGIYAEYISRKKNDVIVLNEKFVWLFSMGFVVAVLLISVSYSNLILRLSILLAFLLICIYFRKRIIKEMKNFMKLFDIEA